MRAQGSRFLSSGWFALRWANPGKPALTEGSPHGPFASCAQSKSRPNSRLPSLCLFVNVPFPACRFCCRPRRVCTPPPGSLGPVLGSTSRFRRFSPPPFCACGRRLRLFNCPWVVDAGAWQAGSKSSGACAWFLCLSFSPRIVRALLVPSLIRSSELPPSGC